MVIKMKQKKCLMNLKKENFIVEKINQIPGITCKDPGGAFYIWPNITKACEMLDFNSAEEFRKTFRTRRSCCFIRYSFWG